MHQQQTVLFSQPTPGFATIIHYTLLYTLCNNSNSLLYRKMLMQLWRQRGLYILSHLSLFVGTLFIQKMYTLQSKDIFFVKFHSTKCLMYCCVLSIHSTCSILLAVIIFTHFQSFFSLGALFLSGADSNISLLVSLTLLTFRCYFVVLYHEVLRENIILKYKDHTDRGVNSYYYEE